MSGILSKFFGFQNQVVQGFLLLLELTRIQMLFRRTGLLLDAALNVETPALQIEGQVSLQFFQTGAGIDAVGAESSVWRYRHMKKVHVRRFFIHVYHCRNDIFLADKICEIGCGFLEKPSGFVFAHAGKEHLVRTDNQTAQMHGVLAHSLDHEQVVNAILDGLHVVG